MLSRQFNYVSLKFQGEVWAGDKCEGVIALEEVFKAIKWDELIL